MLAFNITTRSIENALEFSDIRQSDGPHKRRHRAMSLSLDWDKVVSSVDKGLKIRKRSIGDAVEDVESFVRHPGYIEIERTAQTFATGSCYTGRWNGIGMTGKGTFILPHAHKMTSANKIGILSRDWSNVIDKDPSLTGRKFIQSESFLAYGLSREANVPIVNKSYLQFSDKSTYEGQWTTLGMEGGGLFTFLIEVEYEGTLRDGMFHGEGLLIYPMGQKIEGHWIKGKLVSFKFRFADDLEYDEPWKYCQMPDRRFYTCILYGLRPAGRSLLTNIDPTREIPEGCYDTGDGFYNPKTKCVWSAITPKKILRVPTAAEEQWIMENCRKAWDEPTEYKPELFEHWVSGRQTDSVFQMEDEKEDDSPTNSEDSLKVRMIVEPNYNVSPASSRSWWEQLMGEVPQETSANI